MFITLGSFGWLTTPVIIVSLLLCMMSKFAGVAVFHLSRSDSLNMMCACTLATHSEKTLTLPQLHNGRKYLEPGTEMRCIPLQDN